MVKQATSTSNEADIVALEIRVKALEEKVDYHNRILVRGNGSPSLVEEVHNVVTFMNEWKDSSKYWSRLIIAGIAANILGYSIAAILWFIKIAPLLDRILTAYPAK